MSDRFFGYTDDEVREAAARASQVVDLTFPSLARAAVGVRQYQAKGTLRRFWDRHIKGEADPHQVMAARSEAYHEALGAYQEACQELARRGTSE